MAVVLSCLGVPEEPEVETPMPMDTFGKSDPREMPRYFFHEALALDYSTAVRGEITAQDYRCIPRYWYVDARFRCAACGCEFEWSAAEQKAWYETCRFPVDSRASRCRNCKLPNT